MFDADIQLEGTHEVLFSQGMKKENLFSLLINKVCSSKSVLTNFFESQTSFYFHLKINDQLITALTA